MTKPVWYHKFRKNTKLNLQNDFIFYDTESYTTIKDDKEILKFKMACSIYWNKEKDTITKRTYFNHKKFWIDINSMFNKNRNQIILFAHNSQFDFKMVDGFTELFKRNWSLINFYVKNKTFILTFKKSIGNKKKAYYLHIFDTMNYVARELKELGKAIKLKKLKINFNKSTISELHIYCKRDTEIIYRFIKYLITFLETNDLSRLKATSGSLAFNTYRHKFYDDKNKPIFIHACKRAIQIERASYKGGISDCFRIGNFPNSIKTDINSMYPFIMKTYRLPTKLVFQNDSANYTQSELFKIYNIAKKYNYGIIANVKIYLPQDKAYILHKINKKILFVHGTFEISLCEPELDYIEKYGKILKIYNLNVYKMDYIFTDYVDFFYNLKVESQKDNNSVITQFSKLMLNTLYGKFGQKEILYQELSLSDKWLIENQDIIELMIKKHEYALNNSDIVYLGTIVNDSEIYVINRKLYRLKHLEINSKDTFVAIPSFITSYARMMLVDFIEIAERKNVYYSDTDSIICNRKGYYNLINNRCINKYKLGKLKNEGLGKAKIYAPKFYDFNGSRKIKGVRLKTAKLLNENDKQVEYQIQQWIKLKSDLKEGNTNSQIIKTTTKTVNKLYDKGKVDNLGFVIPYSITEALELF